MVAEAADVVAEHGDVRYAGFVDDAAKEYAEARTSYALALGKPIPLPVDLGVGVTPYLNGLGEAVGEMRRRMLDLLRAEKMDEAESTLDAMETIHGLLASLDYPDKDKHVVHGPDPLIVGTPSQVIQKDRHLWG